MFPRRGRRADRENSPRAAAGLRSSRRRRHPADGSCAGRGRGISAAPDAPTALAGPRDARLPTSDYIAAPYHHPPSAILNSPLTPALSPQAGRGSAAANPLARVAPARRAPGSIPDTRHSRYILSLELRRDAAAPARSAGSPIPGIPPGTDHRNCRSRSRSAPSSDAADLVQQVAQRLLDRPLCLRSSTQKVDLELAFHEMHQLFVALAQMLVPDERILDPVEIGHDADAGVGFLVIVLRGAGQRVNVREHHRHAEIGGQRLGIGLRDVHQLALVLDPAFAEQYVGVQFAVLALVPDLAGAHALQIDVALLIGDIDRQQLARHLLDRHVDTLGGIAAQRLLLLPGLVVAGELLLDLGQGALQRDFPALDAFLSGQPQPEFGARSTGHRRPDPSVEKLFEDRMHVSGLLPCLGRGWNQRAAAFDFDDRAFRRAIHQTGSATGVGAFIDVDIDVV